MTTNIPAGKKSVLNHWPLFSLLFLTITLPIVTFWSVERINAHARWQTQFHMAQTFDFYGMEQASILVSNPTFQSDPNTKEWARTALQTADSELNQLSKQDFGHADQLYRIGYGLETVFTNWSSYTSNLTDTQRVTLSTVLGDIGNKVLYAYTNYINYTSADDIRGPSFWYSGPSPPDESLLQQAVDEAVHLPNLFS